MEDGAGGGLDVGQEKAPCRLTPQPNLTKPPCRPFLALKSPLLIAKGKLAADKADLPTPRITS